MGLVGLVPDYAGLLAVTLCAGFGSAAFHPVASIAVARASGAQRGFGMSLFSAGGNLGFAIGPVLAAWLMTWFGLPGSLALVVPGLLTAAAFHIWRDEFEVAAPRRPVAPGRPDVPVPWRRLVILCAVIIVRSWGYSGLLIFIPLLLRERGIGIETTGNVLFVFLFCGAVGGLIGGHLSDKRSGDSRSWQSRWWPSSLMAATMAVQGALYWVALALSGVAIMASFAVTTVFAQELLPHQIGLASGLTLGLAFGAGGVGVWLSGAMADLVGLQASVWVLVCLPGLAGLLAFFLRGPSLSNG